MTKPQTTAVARFEPKTTSQARAQKLYVDNDCLFLIGSAGSGKTTTAVGLAAVDVLSGGSRKSIVVFRPAAQADRDLGFLPGELTEKIEPYTTPVKQALAKVSFGFTAIRYETVNYIRGCNLDQCVVLVDEAQNLVWKQLVLLLSRLGKDSKIILTGDPEQTDVKPSGRYDCDLLEVADRLRSVKGVGAVYFPEGECLRHPLVGRMLKKLTPR